MGQDTVSELIKRYLEGTGTAAENAVLESWYLEQAKKSSPLSQKEVEAEETRMWRYLQQSLKRPVIILFFRRIAAFITSVILVVGSLQ